MAKFRQIRTSFWKDAYIQDEMTAEDKFFYLYLMTNDQTSQIGIYEITKKKMSFDLGYSMESINALVTRFETYHKLIKYDSETREIILLDWAKDNLNRGGKPFIDLIISELKNVKQKKFLEIISQQCQNENIKKIIVTYINKNSDKKEITSKNDNATNENDTSNDTCTKPSNDKLDDEYIELSSDTDNGTKENEERKKEDERNENTDKSSKNNTFCDTSDDMLDDTYNEKGAINNKDNNKYNYNYNNNYNKKKILKEKSNFSFPFCSENFLEVFNEYKKTRKKKMTDYAIKLFMDKLVKLSNNDEDKAIKIIQQSIENGWVGIFELKENGNKNKSYKQPQQNEDDFKVSAESLKEVFGGL
ncbi:hypothetical protein [Leptotrichia trevisanii]|uniref:hypothetical protein n=1 Tax=Leptotrichia trevisanii TaxID=109328 RepID=UPI0004088E2D|nr:hypothetical protein [Leptotrichia trevisanii]